MEAAKAGSGAKGEARSGGQLADGGPAACLRRVEASSYYDNDGALPSMCAAHRGAKLSLIYLQIDRFAVAKFRLGFEC